MGRTGWKNVLCWMLMVLFVLSVILYVRNQKKDASMTDATLVRVHEEGMKQPEEREASG